jgi:hypothetical protein
MKKLKDEAKARDEELHKKISKQHWTVNVVALKMRRHRAKPIVAIQEKKHRQTMYSHTKQTTSDSSQKMGSSKSNRRKKGKASGEVIFANPLDALSVDDSSAEDE